MDESGDFSLQSLQRCSYRYLQQTAKALGLPSNVKKIYLVQLIYTKKFGTPSEIENIVELVKLERQHLAQGSKRKNGRKKIRLQGTEISSTNNTCQSPPISFTPKRPVVIQCAPNMVSLRKPLIKYRPSLPHQIKTTSTSTIGSDRVLRSFNVKTYKKPNYSLLNNSIIGVIKAQNESPNETKISIVSHGGGHADFNVTARCVMKKYTRPNILNSSSNFKSANELVPVTHDRATSPLAKRRRTLSGIYPINSQATPTNVQYTQSIGFRRTDGKISKINALVQKPKKYYDNFETPSTASSRNVEVTIQDIINSNIDTQTLTNPNVSEYPVTDSYPNMSALTDIMPMNMTPISQNSYREETDASYYRTPNDVPISVQMDTPKSEQSNRKNYQDEAFSVYYHKKIRAEQVRSQRLSLQKDRHVETEQLPRITDVFSNFNDIGRDYSQPLYVQVSEDMQRIPMLESLYTFRSQYLASQPLLQIATTANTTCVYSTSVVATPMQQPSSVAGEQHCNSSPCPRDTYQSNSRDTYQVVANEDVSKMYDILRLAEQEITLRKYHEAYNTSTSSLETSTSQELGTSATIPEMVEDALEIISQDGDYMERIGMDVRMQCILCSWAGPKFILEYHVRKEHSEQILRQDKNEWNITYKLGSLVNQQLWLSQVTERSGALYVLSVKYEDPDCFMAALATLSSDAAPKTGSITIYNKVTGEPYSWQGKLEQIPTNMPYENDSSCLVLELSRLNLLPNSANLKLVNRELVIRSPSKVVVGQPALNDIHIIMFVKIFD